jgi:hypothetical protein
MEVFKVFVLTTKVTRTKILVVSAIAVLAVIFMLFGLGAKQESQNANIQATTITERQSFLKQFGWQIDVKSETVRAFTFPSVFDNVLTTYNILQKKQGFDLTKFKNKKADCYTYTVLNYPDNPTGVVATLLVSDGKIIGGDIHSLELSGFMHGFNKSN